MANTRDFDGTGDYIDLEVNDVTGSHTWVAVIRREADSTWDAILTHQLSDDTFCLSMALTDVNRLQYAVKNSGGSTGSAASSGGGSPFTVTASDNWVIVVMSVDPGAGSGTVILSVYKGGAWTHTTQTGLSLVPKSASGGKIRVGRYENTDDFNGKIAALALWNGTAMTTTQIADLDGGSKTAWQSVAGGYTDLIEVGVGASVWADTVNSQNGTIDMTGSGGNGTIATSDEPGGTIYTLAASSTTINPESLYSAG